MICAFHMWPVDHKHSIIINKNVDELIYQIEAGNVDLQAQNSYGHTVLHSAVIFNRVEQAQVFLEKGADVNVASNDGRTPLILAVAKRNANEFLPLLIKYGADIFAKDKCGMNVLHHMVYYNSFRDCSDLAKLLIEKNASLLYQADLRQYQPIHWAAYRQNHECVKLFLNLGANVNAQTKDKGESPLYLAVGADHFNNTEVVKILLKRGANVHLKTIEGRTALHKVCGMSETHQVQHIIIKLLLSAGADVLAEDYEGRTPFSLISDKDNRKLHIITKIKNTMIKALALKKVCLQPSIELKDEGIIKEYPDKTLWNYFQDCCAYLIRMKFTRFTESSTFLELLTKSDDQIAGLMRNPDFEANFELYNLSGFSMYAKDVQRAFELAQRQYHFMQEQEDVINKAVDHIFPDVVVRRVTRYLWLLNY